MGMIATEATEGVEQRITMGDNAYVVHFRFALHQDVRIIPLGLTGKVYARCDRGAYLEYRVVYWADSKRLDEWLCESELAEANGSKR